MRKVKQLQNINYISKLGGVSSQLQTLSGNYNCTLEKVSPQREKKFEPILFAKFNSQTLKGFQIIAYIQNNFKTVSSVIESLKVYRIDDGSWTETLIGSLSATEYTPGLFTANASLSFLGNNELSGAETYLIRAIFKRRNKKFYKNVYVNHLGCFDNILRARQQIELEMIREY
jgi:hypothetical protein